MDISNTKLLKRIDAELGKSVRPDTVFRDAENVGVSLESVALGLLPLPYDQSKYHFDYGDETRGLSYWWFRCMMLPNDDGVLQQYLSLWERNEHDLGKFFLMPYSDEMVYTRGAGVNYSPWETADVLYRLFFTRIAPGERPTADELLSLLERYQDVDAMKELDQYLTPEFLLQEKVLWSEFLLPPSSAFLWGIFKLGDALFGSALEKMSKELGGGSFETIKDARMKAAILRVRIARELEWPLGVRNFVRMFERIPRKTREFFLLCKETQAYIDMALGKYPVLRE